MTSYKDYTGVEKFEGKELMAIYAVGQQGVLCDFGGITNSWIPYESITTCCSHALQEYERATATANKGDGGADGEGDGKVSDAPTMVTTSVAHAHTQRERRSISLSLYLSHTMVTTSAKRITSRHITQRRW